MQRINKHVISLPLILSLAACATAQFTGGIKEGDKLQKEKSYVYGRFDLLNVHPFDVALNGYNSIGLKFLCEGNKTFTIGFLPKNQEQVLEAPVGHCSLNEIVFTEGAKVASAAPAPKKYTGKLLQDMVLTPGTLNYLGDLEAQVGNSNGAMSYTTHWQITGIADKFNKTTQYFAGKLSDFGQFQKINQLDLHH
jgi:hypothetical protein